MLPIQCDHGFTFHSKVRKMGCQDKRKTEFYPIKYKDVEKTFRMLKEMFQILFKRIDIPLCHMLDLMMPCIYLHNMCIANLDGFDIN
jgi:hypothetical protein